MSLKLYVHIVAKEYIDDYINYPMYTYIAEIRYTKSRVAPGDPGIRLVVVRSMIQGTPADLKKDLEENEFMGCAVLNIRRCEIFGHPGLKIGDELKIL